MCGNGAGTGTTADFITIQEAVLVSIVFGAAVPGTIFLRIAGPLTAMSAGRTIATSISVFASPGTCNPFLNRIYWIGKGLAGFEPLGNPVNPFYLLNPDSTLLAGLHCS